MKKLSLSALLVLLCARVSEAQIGCDGIAINGSITLSDPTQTNRLFQDGVADTCAAPGTCGRPQLGTFHHDVLSFHNFDTNIACVTVNVKTPCTGTNSIYVGAYIGGFDPANICTNNAASIGASPDPTATMSFNVPAGTDFYVVVAEVTANAGCPSYDIKVTGCPAIHKVCRSPNLAIPDNLPAGATDTLVVPSGYAFSDLNVSINATHTWVGDLIFTLTNTTTATSVIVIDRPGFSGTGFGCGNANVGVVMDDEGANGPVENQCQVASPALFGSPTPNNPLTAFDGQAFAGTWSLKAVDAEAADTGTLTQWCLVALSDVIFKDGFQF